MSSNGVQNRGFEDDSGLELENVNEKKAPNAGQHSRTDKALTNYDNKSGRASASGVVDKKEGGGDADVLQDCGLAGISLRFLNRLRSPKWCLLFLCWAALIQGMCVNGLVNLAITSIERRFGLQSTQSGLIASSYDIGSLLVVIPISYLGGRLGASKPRWISLGMLVMGLGSFVWAMPHFLTGIYNPGNQVNGTREEHMCGVIEGDKEGKCDGDKADINLSDYRYLFMLGQFLHGAGAAPLITIGTTFLDESVKKKVSPLYIGIYQTWFVIGPAFGFVIGGQLLNVFTDSIPGLHITPASSLWVGAWWPGFLITGAMAVACAIPLGCFPSNLNKENVNNNANTTEKEESKVMSELPKYLMSLMTNPTYICVTLAGGIDGIILSGLAAFLPKYLENQYRLTTAGAAQLFGLMIVPAGGGGTFFGGWLIKKLKLTRTKIVVMVFLTQSITLLTIPAFFLYCDTPLYAGVNTPHSLSPAPLVTSYYPSLAPSDDLATSSPLLSQCNTDCHCDPDHYAPVCGSDNIMYFSPCLAGCEGNADNGTYKDCSCISDDSSFGLGLHEASHTRCSSPVGCENSNLVPFLILEFIAIFLTFVAALPATVISLRAVHKEERCLGLGLQSIVLRLLGTIPGPLLFGYVLDTICLLWEPDCGKEGSCLLYDNVKMGQMMFGICITAKLVSIFFYGLCGLSSQRSSIVDEMDEKTEEE